MKSPVIAFEVTNRVTTGGGALKKVIVGVKVAESGDERDAIPRDWELLSALNTLAEIPGVSFVEDKQVIQKIFKHLGLSDLKVRPPKVRVPP